MRRTWLALLLVFSAVQANTLEPYGINDDIYLVDFNQDGKASIQTLLAGEDEALVLIYQPTLLDKINSGSFARETAVLLQGSLIQHDFNQDSQINSSDLAHPNLGLLSFDAKTGKTKIRTLTAGQMYIELRDQYKLIPRMTLVDSHGKRYPIYHLLN